MAKIVYALCGLTCLLCTYLLFRGYWRTGAKLPLWSGLCFLALTFNNFLLFIDLIVFPEIDLSLWRNGIGAAAALCFGVSLIWSHA